MDSIRVSEAPDSGSIPDKATSMYKLLYMWIIRFFIAELLYTSGIYENAAFNFVDRNK